ncbi:alpha/beta hydrolase [Patescibacteria group bacterium]|nr:alpha/beta hydrolase [Patescibacteria group bacterium]
MKTKAKTILILHGWGLSGAVFAPLGRTLETAGYTVLAPDLPGFGRSPMPEHPLTLGEYAEYVHLFLREKHVAKPVVIGHSFGGRVALRYQEMFAGGLSALILSGAPGYTPVPRKKLQIFIFIAKVGKFIFSLPMLSVVQNQLRLWYYYLVGARDFYRAEGVMRDTFKVIVQEELEECMRAVRVPAALIWGEEDTICPVAIARRMQRVIRGSELIILEHANHSVPFRQPALFAKTVEAFLSRV